MGDDEDMRTELKTYKSTQPSPTKTTKHKGELTMQSETKAKKRTSGLGNY